MRTWRVAVIVGTLVLGRVSVAGSADVTARRHVRFDNERIAEVFQRVVQRSAAFRKLLIEINASDTFVYIEDGRCSTRTIRSCLMLAASQNGFRYLRIKIQSREMLPVVAAQLAHELQHAAEVAQRSDVVDTATLSALYREIGFATSMKGAPECWETQRALATERLVLRDLDAVRVAGSTYDAAFDAFAAPRSKH